MINEHEFLILRAAIGKRVAEGEGVGAGHGTDLRPQLELRSEEHALIHAPAYADGVWRLAVHRHDHFAGGDVRNLAVQREIHLAGGSGVGDEFVLARMPGKLQAAARHPFVEALNPAEAAAAFEVHKLRMHDFLDRRIPTQPHITKIDIENSHATRGNYTEAQIAVIYLYDFHPLLFAALQDPLPNMPLGIAFVARQVARDHLPVANAIPLLGIGENLLERG